jgi:hypothetical protein
MAWYGRQGDYFRFYEICPQVAQMACDGKWFQYVKNSKANIDVVIADARKALESERLKDEVKWDILVIDAY